MEERKSEIKSAEMDGEIYGGRYVLKNLVGSGTTAQVYLAEDLYTGEPFAAKVSWDCNLLRQEEQILCRIQQNVFPEAKEYFEQEFEGGRKGFLIMEYMEGGTLQHAIDKMGCFAVSEAVWMAQRVLECLKILHGQPQPMIYRDIKPENIMFDREGNLRLIDAAGVIPGKYRVGTYGYAAPEQFWEGSKPGPACDLYAVGKVLAYLLTGKNPGKPPYDMLEYCSRDRRVPGPIFQVLERSLAMEEMGRYGSADDFFRDLEGALQKCQNRKWELGRKKQLLTYEKCIHMSGMQRIF